MLSLIQAWQRGNGSSGSCGNAGTRHAEQEIPLRRANKNLGNRRSRDKKRPARVYPNIQQSQDYPCTQQQPAQELPQLGIVWPSALGALSQRD